MRKLEELIEVATSVVDDIAVNCERNGHLYREQRDHAPLLSQLIGFLRISSDSTHLEKYLDLYIKYGNERPYEKRMRYLRQSVFNEVSHSPGIKQTDLYKLLPDYEQWEIRETIASYSQIQREKAGRTYALRLRAEEV
ncbi:hypothetical protein [Alicyclobacillus sp. SO9]|uniref:hypothetical protein n=1 Tax=Alicyclobacillus sp. SO9 TaxID=2665646 RepID=UPI0018E81988|nr:hypothetical protein [Alicyclobacillus sp. SO9]QQE78095.1 hypothetical protein GI364_19715 [Alicyclobacillus sp. SO9]